MLTHSNSLDHFHMSPINNQRPPHPSSSKSQTHHPKFSQARCNWTLLTEEFQFLYVDPVFRTHLGPQAQSIIGRNLLEFVHPDELSGAQSGLRKVISSRMLHGSATRVRYARLSRLRTCLGFSGTIATYPDEDIVSCDRDYITCDLIINWAADNLVLCFIHAVVDNSPADNNEIHRTPWTNWCGTPEMDIEDSSRLYRALAPISQPYSGDSVPTRIFQILKNTQDRAIVLSWPTHGYDPQEYQRLANNVQMEDSNSSDAKTSCTRRLKAFQNISRSSDWIREVESGFIPHDRIIFACHKSMPFRRRTSISCYSQSPQSYDSLAQNDFPPLLSHQSSEESSNNDSLGYPANYSSHITQTDMFSSAKSSQTPSSDLTRNYHGFHVQNSWQSPSSSPTSQASPLIKQHTGTPSGQRQTESYAKNGPLPRIRDMRIHSEEASGSSRDAYNSTTNKSSPPAGITRCAACKSVSSPEWRKGPSGKKDLCNACGLRYSRAKAKKEGISSRRRRDIRASVMPETDIITIKRRNSDERLVDSSLHHTPHKLLTAGAHPFSHLRDAIENSHAHSVSPSPSMYTYSMEPRPHSTHLYLYPSAGLMTYAHAHHSPNYHYINGSSYHVSNANESPVTGDMSHSLSSTAAPPSSYVRGLPSEHRDGFNTGSAHHYNLH